MVRRMLESGHMKFLLRLLFGKGFRANPEPPLFRFYLTEFNAPTRPKYGDSVYF